MSGYASLTQPTRLSFAQALVIDRSPHSGKIPGIVMNPLMPFTRSVQRRMAG